MLEVRRENDGFITCFSRKLDTHVPRIQRHERKLEVLRQEVVLSKCIETVDCIPEGSCRADMFPGQGRQARWDMRSVNCSASGPMTRDCAKETYCRAE